MRYMIIVKATPSSEAGVMPRAEDIQAMDRFNEELIAAGVLLAAEGLRSSAQGVRVRRENGQVVMTDGPFAETKELVAGFWLLNVKSREEVLAWARKIPFEPGMEVEVRKVFETSDLPAGFVSDEHRAMEAAWREANQKPITR